jgi:hypothetical protein
MFRNRVSTPLSVLVVHAGDHGETASRFTRSITDLPKKRYADRLQEQPCVLVCIGGGMDGDSAAWYHLLRISGLGQPTVLDRQPTRPLLTNRS